jgi:hypothetical protein
MDQAGNSRIKLLVAKKGEICFSKRFPMDIW